MVEKKKFDNLIVISKICSELGEYFGLNDEDLAGFIIHMASKDNITLSDFEEDLKNNKDQIPSLLLEQLFRMIELVKLMDQMKDQNQSIFSEQSKTVDKSQGSIEENPSPNSENNDASAPEILSSSSEVDTQYLENIYANLNRMTRRSKPEIMKSLKKKCNRYHFRCHLRSRGHGKKLRRGRSRGHDRSRSRSKSRGHDRSRSQSRSRGHSRSRSRGRSHGHGRPHFHGRFHGHHIHRCCNYKESPKKNFEPQREQFDRIFCQL